MSSTGFNAILIGSLTEASGRQAVLKLARLCFDDADQTDDLRSAAELRRIGEGFLRLAAEPVAT